MPLNDLQKQTAEAIINIFETGKLRGRYDAVTVMKGDSGHLSYGRSQASLGSGMLYLLLKDYCAAPGARFASQFAPFLPRFRDKDFTLDTDTVVRALLREAGDDPVMQQVQDQFFDRLFWQRAVAAAGNCGLSLPLCVAVVYDGFIQGGFGRIRDRVNGGQPASAGFGEKDWTAAYVDARKRWLLSCAPPLPATVYRMDAFSSLMKLDNWELDLPLTVRGVGITAADFAARAEPVEPARVSEEGAEHRVLELTQPFTRGDDVRRLQAALNTRGYTNEPDGVFGSFTQALVKQFQKDQGLAADGVVGPVTWAALLQPLAAAAGNG